MKTRLMQAAGLILAALLALSVTGVASADSLPSLRADVYAPVIPSDTSVAAASSWLAAALSLRASQLSNLSDAINASKTLTNQDNTSLTTIVSDATLGISALSTSSANDATLSAIRTDAATMVSQFHVFSVVSPQVHLTLKIDDQLSMITKFIKLEPAMAAALATQQSAAKTTINAVAADHDFVTQLNNASAALAGLSSSALALSPTGDITNVQSTLQSDFTILHTAEADVSNADTDLHQIVDALANPALAGGLIRASI